MRVSGLTGAVLQLMRSEDGKRQKRRVVCVVLLWLLLKTEASARHHRAFHPRFDCVSYSLSHDPVTENQSVALYLRHGI